MIPVVEDILKSTIKSQLNFIKSNPDIINKVFNSSGFKTFITNSKINVIQGFPREPSVLPCYCIILGAEEESPEAIGDYLDNYTNNEETNLEEVTETQIVRYDTQSGNLIIRLDEVPVYDITEISGVDSGFELTSGDLGLITITNSNISHGDELEITYNKLLQQESLFGTMMRATYRIECWSENGDLTVYMYYLLKFIMLLKRKYLANQGLLVPILSGGDFEPVPEYFPSFVFRRTLNISCQVENIFNEQLDSVQEISIL